MNWLQVHKKMTTEGHQLIDYYYSQLRFGKTQELRGGWEEPITATRVSGAGATKTTAFGPSIG